MEPTGIGTRRRQLLALQQIFIFQRTWIRAEADRIDPEKEAISTGWQP